MNTNILNKLKIQYEILKIYNKLFDEANTYNDIIKLYFKYLKLQVLIDKKIPYFLPSPDGFKYGNCYTYALGLTCPKDFWELCCKFNKRINFDVGFIRYGNDWVVNNSEEQLLDNFYADCELLKIRVYKGEILPMHGGYKVFLFVDKLMASGKSVGYHFVRENKWGILSNKNGYNGEIEKLSSLDDISHDCKLIRTLEIVR